MKKMLIAILLMITTCSINLSVYGQEGTLHQSSVEYMDEQGNVIDSNQDNDWLYQYKYNISDSLLPSNGYEADDSKIFNLEAFYDNPEYIPINNLSLRQEEINSRMWSTAIPTRAWMGHGHNIFIGDDIMQPCYGYDAVKTWVNTYGESKKVRINGSIQLINPTMDASGVEVLILKGSDLLFKKTITNATSVLYDVTVKVLHGDKVHFLVHQNSNLGEGEKSYTMRNRVTWDPSIQVLADQYDDPNDEPNGEPYIDPVPEQSNGIYCYSPVDHGGALNNPEMGLHFAYYDNFLGHYGDGTAPSDTLDYFEGMNVLYLRAPWSLVEAVENQYDWSKIDELIGHWTAKGKKIGFRLTAHEDSSQATPIWVKEKGANGWYRNDALGSFWIPNSGDSIFQTEYKDFLKEFNRKYGNNPSVEFIEMGALGVWGEGHGGGSLQDFRAFGDIFRGSISNKILLWPDDSGAHIYGDSIATNGFGLYDDSIGWSNRMGNIDAANRFWKTNHIRVEMTHYFEPGARTFFMNTPIKLLQSIENIHGSYFLVHAFPDRFWDENADIARRINRRLGYRFNIENISWPQQVIGDSTPVFTVRLRNAGVAPNYKGGHVTVSILDGNGQLVAEGTNTNFNTKDLVVKDNQRDKTTYSEDEVTAIQVPVNIPSNALTGEYKVYVSIGDANGNPIYELPYKTNVEDKNYHMGAVHVVDQLPTFNLTAGNATNGTITLSKNEATQGELITITTTPESGYTLQSISVNNQVIQGNTFHMPAENVAVTAVFERLSHEYKLEYTTTQGNISDADTTNNWLYQYVPYTNTNAYTPTVTGIQHMTYADNRWVREGGSYPGMNDTIMHPDNGYDSVRTWVNTYSNEDVNELRILGSAKKLDSNGNGVKVTIMKNNDIIWGSSVITNTTATDFDITTTIEQGDRIHFVVNQNSPLVGQPASDVSSRWFDNLHIETTIQPIHIPDPSLFTLTAGNTSNGTITLSKNQATQGELITVSATPEAEYILQSISVNNQEIQGNTFQMPAENVTVTAVFKRIHVFESEYTTTQGNISDTDTTNNWLYQYVPYTNTSAYTPTVTGIQNLIYNGSHWVREGGSFPTIGDTGMHSDNGFDSVITWVNTYSVEVVNRLRIVGSAKKYDSNGNGVKLTIMKNNQIIWGSTVITDTTTSDVDITITVQQGDKIHFVMNQNSPLVGQPSSNTQSRWFDNLNLETSIEPLHE